MPWLITCVVVAFFIVLIANGTGINKQKTKNRAQQNSNHPSIDAQFTITVSQPTNNSNMEIGKRYGDMFYRIHFPLNFFAEVVNDVEKSFVVIGAKPNGYDYKRPVEIFAVRYVNFQEDKSKSFHSMSNSSTTVQQLIDFIGSDPVILDHAWAIFEYIYDYMPTVTHRVREIDIVDILRDLYNQESLSFEDWCKNKNLGVNHESNAVEQAYACAITFIHIYKSDEFRTRRRFAADEVERQRQHILENRDKLLQKRILHTAQLDTDIALIQAFRSILIANRISTTNFSYEVLKNGYINFMYRDMLVFKAKNRTKTFVIIPMDSDFYSSNKNHMCFEQGSQSDGKNTMRLIIDSPNQLMFCTEYIITLKSNIDNYITERERTTSVYKQNYYDMMVKEHYVSPYISIDNILERCADIEKM